MGEHWGMRTPFEINYRGWTGQVPGMLFEPLSLHVSWPSQSGFDARIDPFGQGTQEAWGKTALCLNWCDPNVPTYRPTRTYAWWKEMYRKLTGRDEGALSATRVPEVIVTVTQDGKPVAGAAVFVRPLAGQGLEPYGVRADADGRAWFVLTEEGPHEFVCTQGGRTGKVVVEAKRHAVDVAPGYSHVQNVELEVTGQQPPEPNSRTAE